MRVRHASIDDVPVEGTGRLYHRPARRRPDHHPGLTEPGLSPGVVHRPGLPPCQNPPAPELLLPGGDRMVGRRSSRG
ncbi:MULTISPECIES: hypothetical protein [Streptomyces]|uniref:Uncharacterized protein n=1 Tax=Streptomyces glycanivorans TaxID=3033808 RepID=A0ABY9JL60_9ACTN|nr:MULTISPECIES: hypothetical protein [unclassified Streptomyces]WSQ81824.1 hypothetical protein OG725_34065 [Streptomyces sp. NBC_01213]WLQ68465.1 hypothetical protein P8A20_35060 [Streptomyces sp. Alt3]WSQ89150.1 hypothetical protein OG722_34460 [Streptomyces sp. NBC_01212]WSR04844.1 hypothetical protein OG265_02040 [Streptomyces sp. NBC_01208]WSR52545.1 hypothetical protein OG279_35055 [Streptomyces sp. NBC_01201]